MHRISRRRLSTAIRHGGDALNSTRRDDGNVDVPLAGFLQVPRNDEESIVSLRVIFDTSPSSYHIAPACNFSRPRSKPLGRRVARDTVTPCVTQPMRMRGQLHRAPYNGAPFDVAIQPRSDTYESNSAP